MTRLYGPHLQELDLTYPQYLVLLALWTEQPRSVGDLGAELGLNFGTLSPLLKRMEVKGLLQRQRQADDERRVSITLTAQGEDLRQSALAMQKVLQCELDLPDESVAQLRDGVQQLTRSLLNVELNRI